jgi:thiol-disulfide isomerase/thioredoxin
MLAAVLAAGACASGGHGGGSRSGSREEEPEPIVGPTTPAAVLAARPDWVEALASAQPEAESAGRLATFIPDREVVVFFGTWCSDSRRELTRLWRAEELAGGEFGFPIRYVGVDRSKTEPADLLEGVDLQYVPTMVVLENGRELGRIVETAPHGIEGDLIALLTGEAHGWLSEREDLEPAPGLETPR